jgi:1-acyl-sn-glycerol-3-phosphate acyltransferase
VLIYPEGTRFTDRKRASALAHLEAEGRADLAAIARDFTHVLPPRLGGPLRLLEAMRGVDVVFLDQCGFEGARSFASLVRGALVGSAIRVRLRRVEAARVPRERLDVWLFEQWRETNAWVAAHQGAHAR